MPRFVKTQNGETAKENKSGVVIPVGGTAERNEVPQTGVTRFNSDTGVLEVFNGTEFKSVAKQGLSSISVTTLTGDGSTIAYSISTNVDSGNQLLVFVGNVFQIFGTNYTYSSGTITFTSPPPDTHTIVVLDGFASTQVN